MQNKSTPRIIITLFLLLHDPDLIIFGFFFLYLSLCFLLRP